MPQCATRSLDKRGHDVIQAPLSWGGGELIRLENKASHFKITTSAYRKLSSPSADLEGHQKPRLGSSWYGGLRVDQCLGSEDLEVSVI